MRHCVAKNKKGMSLVELIAIVAITTIVVAASCAALYSGTKSAAVGQADYTTHSDAHLLETWLRKNLPTAVKLNISNRAESSPDAAEVLNLHFGLDGDFVIDKAGSGPVMNVSGIRQVVLQTSNVGINEKVKYEITAVDSGRSFVLSGGIVLNNIGSSASSGTSKTTILPADTSTYINISK